jgi:hypothetical protein
MKRDITPIGIVLFALCLAAFGYAETSPTPFDTSKIDFSKITDEDILATERHRDALRAGAKAALDEQAKVNVDQSKTLQEIEAANEQTRKQFEAYQAAAETQIEKGNKAIVALEHVLKKLHLAKWILCAVWVGLVGLAITKVPLPFKGYGIYAGVALIAGGCAFIWLWL